MNYLTEYNISLDEIKSIKSVLETAEVNMAMFKYNETKIKSVLDLFIDIGVKNIYEIITTHPYMFYDTVDSIKIKINSYKNKDELALLIDSNPDNLSLIGIY